VKLIFSVEYQMNILLNGKKNPAADSAGFLGKALIMS